MPKTLTRQEQELDNSYWMEKNLRNLKVGQKVALDYMGMLGELEMFCIERNEKPLQLTLRPRLFGVFLPEVQASFRDKKWSTK